MNAGGQNKAVPEQGKIGSPKRIKDFPWVIDPSAKKWGPPDGRKNIRKHLRELLYKNGILTSELQAAELSKLCMAHYMLACALRAIDENPIDPKLGTGCAYVAVPKQYGAISSAMRILGIKFDKAELEVEEEDDDSIMDPTRNKNYE